MYTKVVKNVNESQIARFMLKKSAFTKQEAAADTGLSFPTVGKIVDGFVERQMVREIGVDDTSAGGRKPKLYGVNKDFAYGILMFFDQSLFFCEVVNAVGETVEKFTRAVKQEGYLATIRSILSEKTGENSRIVSVSIGVHGGVADGKILYIDGYDELVGCELRRILEEEYQLEVTVENNMRTVVYGMAVRKQLLEEETVVCLQIAENGPGCGVLVNGKPLSGFAGLVGEVGYLPACGKKNMQEIALSRFQGEDPEDYFARLIVSACVFFNPRQITLYENDYIQDPDSLRRKCGQYLPESAVPGIVLSAEYEKDFMTGLCRLALNSFYPSFRIVCD